VHYGACEKRRPLYVAGSLKRIHDFVFCVGQGELEYGAARFIRVCPQPAAMGIDDRQIDSLERVRRNWNSPEDIDA
jgi:hypothetical protein